MKKKSKKQQIYKRPKPRITLLIYALALFIFFGSGASLVLNNNTAKIASVDEGKPTLQMGTFMPPSPTIFSASSCPTSSTNITFDMKSPINASANGPITSITYVSGNWCAWGPSDTANYAKCPLACPQVGTGIRDIKISQDKLSFSDDFDFPYPDNSGSCTYSVTSCAASSSVTPQPTPTPTPTPGTSAMCPMDTGTKIIPRSCICADLLAHCVSGRYIEGMGSGGTILPPLGSGYASRVSAFCSTQGDGWYCIMKPVIYLYPLSDARVSVKVKTEGNVVISDPLYPANGWKNVLAHPDGNLEYQGKTYRELFYESDTPTLHAPHDGIIIKSSELKTELLKYVTLLGLTRTDEQQEFLDFWVPRLQALHSHYIMFSVLDRTEKARVDNVEISPKPNTFTDFIAYFKPLSKIEDVPALEITPAPVRRGFTAVEWGGVIDNK